MESDDDDNHSENMSWIDDETMEEDFYDAFYISPIETVQIVQMLFSNDCQKCLSVSRASYQLSKSGVITPEELIPILKCQTTNGFHPFSVLKFAIELDTTNLTDFVTSDYDSKLQEVSYTNNIVFKDSVKALEPTATLFILYKRKQSKKLTHHRQTRMVRVKKSAPDKHNQSRPTTNKTRRKSVSFYD